MNITVKSKYISISPRKMRLVADLIRGCHAERALDQLRYISKESAVVLAKTLKSALAAAKDSQMDINRTYVNNIAINEGPRLKRRVMVSKGRSTSIHKQMSHIILTLSEQSISPLPKPNIPFDKIQETAQINKDEVAQVLEARKENHGS